MTGYAPYLREVPLFEELSGDRITSLDADTLRKRVAYHRRKKLV